MKQTHFPIGVLARIGLDLVLTATMLALFSFHLTGPTLHEWLGLALCVLVVVHMLVSWRWLAAITRRLLSPLSWRARLTYLLNASLFVSIVIVTLSGLMISEVLFRDVVPQGSNLWRALHSQSANVTLLLMAVHLGVYGRQVVGMVRRVGGAAWQRLAGSVHGGHHDPRPVPQPVPAMSGRR